MKRLLTIFALMLVAFTTNAQSCPDNHHPHMIDLGLPSGTKWACCNVDDDPSKQSPTNFGGYYAWGEMNGNKEVYDENSYMYYQNGSYVDIGNDISGTEYDVAHVKWGGTWRLPSNSEIEELVSNCRSEWITLNGVAGCKFTSEHNNSSIFLPAAGHRYGLNLSTPSDGGSLGDYWSSTLGFYSDRSWAYDLDLYTYCVEVMGWGGRTQGESVRPVCTSPVSTIIGDVNGDGEVNVNDVMLTVSHILGLSNNLLMVAADVNDDLDINVTDVMEMVRYILGASGELELGWYMVARQVDGYEQAIPMKDVGKLVAVGNAYDFTILDTNGNVILENVLRADVKFSNNINTLALRPAKTSRYLTGNDEAHQPVWKTKTVEPNNHPFVVANKNGNSHFAQGVTFKYGENGLSWTADGQTGAVRDLSFIARTNTTLATADGEDIIKMLEELSGTDQADAGAISTALASNPDVEESYTADGENVVVKIKDDDSYAACPMYSLGSVFSDEGEIEILLDMADAGNKVRHLKSYTGKEKVAIFNFFEGGFSTHGSPYETKHIFVQLLSEMFKKNLYNVEVYGHGFDNGGTPTFTMSKLDEVISHSSEYSAIIIMSHGYTTSNGESYFATCEQYKKGASNPSNQTVIIDNNIFLAHSSKIQLASNCLLYLGSCFGIPKNGYENVNTSVVGWKGKNAVSQIHAGVFFHKLLYSDRWVGVKEALESSFRTDPFNPSALMYATPSVNEWDFILNTGLQQDYAEGMVLRIGSGRDIFVKKTSGTCKFDISGHIKGGADNYLPFVRVKLEPIVRIQNPGEYSFTVPPMHNAKLTGQDGGNDHHFEDSYTIDDDFLEGVYRINVYVMTQLGWKLLIQPEPVYVIHSKKLDDNYALPTASDEDVYMPSVIGDDGQPVEEITVPAGTSQTYQLDAYNGHTFETPCLDTNVATVSLSGKTLTVTGVSEGSTVFGVFDRQNHQMAVVNVTVTPGGSLPSYLTCPDDHHPHMIDLGLPSGTKWACCNVGADKPEAYGGYYAWGETEEKSTYNWSTYIHCDGSESTCHDLGSNIAGTQYDVAHYRWGGSWVMPSYDQNKELIENCTYEWTTLNGVNGGKFTSKKNGGTIFLPAAGYRWKDGLIYAGSNGYYWSSTQRPSNSYYAYNPYYAYSLGFYSGKADWYSYSRYSGHTVRPVSR